MFTFFRPLLCVEISLLAFLRLTCVKTCLICSHKEYLDLKNKLSELRNRERFLLERRTATYSTSSAEPSPPCTTPSSSGATSPIPSSRSSFTGSDHPFSPPLRAHIRVHLPNHQYTVVSIGQYIQIDFFKVLVMSTYAVNIRNKTPDVYQLWLLRINKWCETHKLIGC